MNLVLLEPAELNVPLPRTDPRAKHILDVLRRAPGDHFDAGVVDGALGKATLNAITDASLEFTFTPTHEPPPLARVTLLVGLPRPQTARDVLRDATTLGVECIHFIATERADKNYATSTLWTSGEWRRHCLTGAAQAFDTRLPKVTWTHTLTSALAALNESAASANTSEIAARIALDNYEATGSLTSQLSASTTAVPSPLPLVTPMKSATVLAFGPERGWGPADRVALRAAGFTLAHLGTRVLRVETAIVAAVSISTQRI